MSKFKRLILAVMLLLIGIPVINGFPNGTAFAYGTTSIPKYHEIPAYQMKDIYSTQMVTIGPLDVKDGEKSSSLVSDEITFTIYNSTLQKVEREVTTVNGELPTFELTEDFNYIFMVLNNDVWRMNNLYVWVHDGKLYNIKSYEKNLAQLKKDKGDKYTPTEAERIRCYDEITSLKVFNSNGPEDTSRIDASQNYKYISERNVDKAGNIYVCYDGKPVESGVEIVFTSDRETVTAKTDDCGRVQPTLLEDVNYMVSTTDSRYEIDPFPIAGKDKSEYDAGRYFYDHSSCHRVGLRYEVRNGDTISVEDESNPIVLVDKGEAHKNDTTITSISGRTTAKGMNFKDIILMDRTVDMAFDNFSDKDYKVLDITPVNPHRGEICKLATGNYEITESAYSRKVNAVYEADNNGQLLHKLNFEQRGNKVTFQMSSLGIYRIVLVYDSAVTPSLSISSKSYTYDGKVKKPSVTIKAGEKTLNSSDYSLTYSSGCKNVGSYRVIVTLTGNRKGSNQATYQINPKGTSIKKVTAIRKGFKVSWNKQKVQTTGYQIQYSTSSRFSKGNKTVTIGKNNTSSKSVKKLSRKKKYYIRIRTYKTIKGTKYYSGWSKIKSKKTK